ncbi:hypothetical protein FRB99_007942 [Tulasnella sp. 403]|nr:hypothetical protein FRB99_007942 [Tulasnella sp. 403]
MGILHYILAKILVVPLRLLSSDQSWLTPLIKTPRYKLYPPTSIYYIPSTKDKSRTIRIHAYSPQQYEGKLRPVHLNFHAGAFSVNAIGNEAEYCQRLARTLGITVLDCGHAHAPEYPWPHALNDVKDILDHVFANGDKYDVSRVSIGGFSSGANLALSTAATAFPSDSPNPLVAVLAHQPVVDISLDPWQRAKRAQPCPSGVGLDVPPALVSLLLNGYTAQLPGNVSFKDPRISPLYGDPARFPKTAVFITCEYDSLTQEAEDLAEKLRSAGTVEDVVLYKGRGVGHMFEAILPRPAGGILAERTDEAHEVVTRALRRAYNRVGQWE